MPRSRVSYFYDSDIGSFSYGLGHPMKPYRMRVTHELVASYGMLEKMNVIRPHRASPTQMTAFHTDEYVEFLNKITPETLEDLNGHRYLLGELDNPIWDGVFDFCSIYCGGSIAAAEELATGASDIAINWAGGLHHAKKREASGFCYINDIVLCILELLRSFTRVLYIDIDCHHGDGVEEAFYATDRVLTCSFHKFGEHYFPGTGALGDRGMGKGRAYSVNVPFRDGLSDEPFRDVFESVISRILEWYRPTAVVLQCGADSLAGDKLGCLNISMDGHASCVTFLRKSGIPLVLLGGGGYTVKNVARAWTFETACALGVEEDIPLELPYSPYFDWFGPRYRLEVPPANVDDHNLRDGYIETIKHEVVRHLHDLPFAPSVGMQDVPRDSLATEIGLHESSRELDNRLQSAVDRDRDGASTDGEEVDRLLFEDANTFRAHSNSVHTKALRAPLFSLADAVRAKLSDVDTTFRRRSFFHSGGSLWSGPGEDVVEIDEDADGDGDDEEEPMEDEEEDEDERWLVERQRRKQQKPARILWNGVADDGE